MGVSMSIHTTDNTPYHQHLPPLSLAYVQRGDMHHRDGGPDPTELELTVQQVIHRPTGGRHTSSNYPSQPVMGGLEGSRSLRLSSDRLWPECRGPARSEGGLSLAVVECLHSELGVGWLARRTRKCRLWLGWVGAGSIVSAFERCRHYKGPMHALSSLLVGPLFIECLIYSLWVRAAPMSVRKALA